MNRCQQKHLTIEGATHRVDLDPEALRRHRWRAASLSIVDRHYQQSVLGSWAFALGSGVQISKLAFKPFFLITKSVRPIFKFERPTPSCFAVIPKKSYFPSTDNPSDAIDCSRVIRSNRERNSRRARANFDFAASTDPPCCAAISSRLCSSRYFAARMDA